MTDREALIAGIAADPDNDLRRLVFADWLEENGEPERAEFVRLQVEAARLFFDDVKESLFNSLRAKNLFSVHWRKWFRPFAAVLHPGSESDPSLAAGTDQWGPACRVTWGQFPFPSTGFLQWVRIARGFPDLVRLNLSAAPAFAGETIPLALRCEPARLSVITTAARPQWHAFAGEWLRQVTTLSLAIDLRGWPGTTAFCRDPNLGGVRSFRLSWAHDGRVGFDVPARVVGELADSPLGQQLEELTLPTNAEGVRELCRRPMPQLRKLHLIGEVNADGVRQLDAAPFAPNLASLTFGYLSGADGLSVLARASRFRSLSTLCLRGFTGSANGLRALSEAPFLAQLQQLVVERFADDTTVLAGELAERLTPGVLRVVYKRGGPLSDLW